MLNLMRKHAGSWMIKVILFAIVVVFVFWGVGSFTSRNQTQVADVNGEIISVETYRQAYYQLLENFRRLYGEQLNDDLLKMLRPGQQALDNLISRILMLQESDRLGIDVNDQELADAIQAIAAFQNDGVFDYQRYQQLLSFNKMTAEQFEQTQEQDLRIGKLQSLITSAVNISDEEARQWYEWNNAEVNLDYVVFEANNYNDVTPTQEQIAKYFEQNVMKYQTEPQVRVRYLYFDPNAYQEGVQVTDEKVAEYYQQNAGEFKTEKTVQARHILFKVEEDSDPAVDEEKKALAAKVAEMAKSGKSFDQLAKQYSEGPTRDKGGFLGTFKRNAMVKPFADTAFSMNAGDISEPVRTQFGWHVIKVEKVNEASTESLEDATPNIRNKLRLERARQKALEAAEKVYDSVFDGDDLGDAGKTHQVPVMDTELFAASGFKDKKIGNPQQFVKTSFELDLMAISQIQDWDDGYYLLQVVEQVASKSPKLESVVERVRKDVTKELQRDRAKADAEAMLADIKKDTPMAEASRRAALQVNETGFFKRTGGTGKIGYEPRISAVAFELSTDQPLSDQVVEGRQGWYVLRLKERKLPPRENFVKELKSTRQRLVTQRKQAVFQQWIADLRARSKIDINQERVQQ
ncbi:MAG: SurA N-terminal domain-containing protein [Desulfobacteraceae bacterium]|jgi:peptidyl-prolyl cis-trans isomerase D